jgi:hypothetical protein
MQDIHKEPAGAVFVRLPGPVFRALEDWRRHQPDIPHRSQALRRLIEKALNSDAVTA